jgi:hypothetical protein
LNILQYFIAEGLYGVKYDAYNKEGERAVFSSGFQQPVFVRGRRTFVRKRKGFRKLLNPVFRDLTVVFMTFGKGFSNLIFH